MRSPSSDSPNRELHERLTRIQNLFDEYDAERAQAWAFVNQYDDPDREGGRTAWEATAAATSRPPL